MKVLIFCAVIGALTMAAHEGVAAKSGMSGSRPSSTMQTNTLSPAHTTGQPNQSCGSATAPTTPGNAASASGSAFNPTGKSGSVYAGEQPQNSRNSASVSQYDTACAHQPK